MEHGTGNALDAELKSVEIPLRDAFRKNLKNRLLHVETPPSIAVHRRTRFFQRFVPSKKVAFRALRGVASVTAAFAVIVSGLFFSASLPTQASDDTFITEFYGDVQMVRDDRMQRVSGENLILSRGSVVSTKENSGATIRFFEDTVMRLDENTIMRVESLEPHEARSDLGFAAVTLVKGRAWVRTYSVNEEFSRFVVRYVNGAMILDSGGAADIEVSSATMRANVWHRTASFVRPENQILVSEGSQYVWRSALNSEAIGPIDDTKGQTAWVQQNLVADKEIENTFIANKIERREQELVERMGAMQSSFRLPFGDSEPQELTDLEDIFFIALQELFFSPEGESASLNAFVDKTREIFPEYRDEVIAFMASAQKTLANVLPDSPLYSMKEAIDTLQEEFLNEQERIVAREKRKTERLWEAKTLANTGNVALAEEIVRQAEQDESGEEVPEEFAAVVLEEKQEQIAAIGRLEQEGVSSQATENLETSIMNESSELLRPGFDFGSKTDHREEAFEIVSSIKIYENEVGQRNTLRIKLRQISNTAESLQLLTELKKRLPENLQGEVNDKVFSILNDERKRAHPEPVDDEVLPDSDEEVVIPELEEDEEAQEEGDEEFLPAPNAEAEPVTEDEVLHEESDSEQPEEPIGDEDQSPEVDEAALPLVEEQFNIESDDPEEGIDESVSPEDDTESQPVQEPTEPILDDSADELSFGNVINDHEFYQVAATEINR